MGSSFPVGIGGHHPTDQRRLAARTRITRHCPLTFADSRRVTRLSSTAPIRRPSGFLDHPPLTAPSRSWRKRASAGASCCKRITRVTASLRGRGQHPLELRVTVCGELGHRVWLPGAAGTALPRHVAGHRAADHRRSLSDGLTAHFAGSARVGFDGKSAIIGSLAATTTTAGALEHSTSAGQVEVEQAAAVEAQPVERHERHGGTLPTCDIKPASG